MSKHPEDRPASDASDADAGGADLFDSPPRSAERFDQVLALVRREWLDHPDERFFQLVSNLAVRLGVSTYAFALEDDKLIEMLGERQKDGGRG